MSDPQTDRVCEISYIDPVAGKIISCKQPSTYRVRRYSERQVLQDDDSWETETSSEEYLCDTHFNHLYNCHPFYAKIYGKCDPKLNTPLDLGAFSYKRFESSIPSPTAPDLTKKQQEREVMNI